MNQREKADLDAYITREDVPDEPEDSEEEEVLCTPSAALACVNARCKECTCGCGGANHGKNAGARKIGGKVLRRILPGIVLLLGACREITSPIRPCEYIGKQQGGFVMIAYKDLPCYDGNMDRVVRAKEGR